MFKGKIWRGLSIYKPSIINILEALTAPLGIVVTLVPLVLILWPRTLLRTQLDRSRRSPKRSIHILALEIAIFKCNIYGEVIHKFYTQPAIEMT